MKINDFELSREWINYISNEFESNKGTKLIISSYSVGR